MQVTTVSASVRYSKGLGPNEYKTVELTAEAHVDPDEDWLLAQQGLYAMLTAQLRALWGQNGAASRTCPEWPYDGRRGR
jgi:hypothetical protein